MIKEAIGTGSTVEEAKEAALKALEAPEDADIKYEVLEREKKALFGIFGGAQAKVKASYEYEEDIINNFYTCTHFLLLCNKHICI